MGKLLVILIAVAVAIWWLSGRRRGSTPPPASPDKPAPPPSAAGPQAMIACAHCGLHLPREDAVLDAADRPFCSEAHRLAGPRPPGAG